MPPPDCARRYAILETACSNTPIDSPLALREMAVPPALLSRNKPKVVPFAPAAESCAVVNALASIVRAESKADLYKLTLVPLDPSLLV